METRDDRSGGTVSRDPQQLVVLRQTDDSGPRTLLHVLENALYSRSLARLTAPLLRRVLVPAGNARHAFPLVRWGDQLTDAALSRARALTQLSNGDYEIQGGLLLVARSLTPTEVEALHRRLVDGDVGGDQSLLLALVSTLGLPRAAGVEIGNLVASRWNSEGMDAALQYLTSTLEDLSRSGAAEEDLVSAMAGALQESELERLWHHEQVELINYSSSGAVVRYLLGAVVEPDLVLPPELLGGYLTNPALIPDPVRLALPEHHRLKVGLARSLSQALARVASGDLHASFGFLTGRLAGLREAGVPDSAIAEIERLTAFTYPFASWLGLHILDPAVRLHPEALRLLLSDSEKIMETDVGVRLWIDFEENLTAVAAAWLPLPGRLREAGFPPDAVRTLVDVAIAPSSALIAKHLLHAHAGDWNPQLMESMLSLQTPAPDDLGGSLVSMWSPRVFMDATEARQTISELEQTVAGLQLWAANRPQADKEWVGAVRAAVGRAVYNRLYVLTGTQAGLLRQGLSPEAALAYQNSWLAIKPPNDRPLQM